MIEENDVSADERFWESLERVRAVALRMDDDDARVIDRLLDAAVEMYALRAGATDARIIREREAAAAAESDRDRDLERERSREHERRDERRRSRRAL